MDPGTLALAAAAVQAVGAIQAGNAAQAEAQARANANRYNAQVKQMQARVAAQQANAKEEQQRRAGRAFQSKQMAALAQAGIGFGGSALDLIDDASNKAELDALTIRYEGTLQTKGLLAEAEGEMYQADVNIMAGKNAKKASYLNAGAALLQGGSSYMKYNPSSPSTT